MIRMLLMDRLLAVKTCGLLLLLQLCALSPVAAVDRPDCARRPRSSGHSRGCSRSGQTHHMRSVHHNQQYLEIENTYYISSPDGHKERYIQSFPFRYFFRYDIFYQDKKNTKLREVHRLLRLTQIKLKKIYFTTKPPPTV